MGNLTNRREREKKQNTKHIYSTVLSTSSARVCTAEQGRSTQSSSRLVSGGCASLIGVGSDRIRRVVAGRRDGSSKFGVHTV